MAVFPLREASEDFRDRVKLLHYIIHAGLAPFRQSLCQHMHTLLPSKCSKNFFHRQVCIKVKKNLPFSFLNLFSSECVSSSSVDQPSLCSSTLLFSLALLLRALGCKTLNEIPQVQYFYH